jgi:hypothetical protein
VLEGNPAGIRHHLRIQRVGDGGMRAGEGLHHQGHLLLQALTRDLGHDGGRVHLARSPHEVHEADAIAAQKLRIVQRVQQHPLRVLEPLLLEDRGPAVKPQIDRHPPDKPVAIGLHRAERGHDRVGPGLDHGVDDGTRILKPTHGTHGPRMIHRHHELLLFGLEHAASPPWCCGPHHRGGLLQCLCCRERCCSEPILSTAPRGEDAMTESQAELTFYHAPQSRSLIAH